MRPTVFSSFRGAAGNKVDAKSKGCEWLLYFVTTDLLTSYSQVLFVPSGSQPWVIQYHGRTIHKHREKDYSMREKELGCARSSPPPPPPP